LAAAGLLAAALPARAQQQPAASIVALDNAFQEMYRSATGSMVRVNVTQSARAVLDNELMKQFEEWRRDNDQAGGGGRGGRGGGGGGGPGGGGGRGNPAGTRPDGRDGGNNGQGPGGSGGGGGPGPGFGGGGGRGPGGFNQQSMTNQVTNFLRYKSEQLDKNAKSPAEKQEVARLRGLVLRLELNRNGFQGEMSAILLDNQGHALLLTGLLREAHPDPFTVTLPGGIETTARYTGGSLYGGFTILTLANSGNVKPAAWARKRLVPGQLLLSISAGQGVATPVLAASRQSSGNLEEHIALAPDERGGGFFFDSSGNLALAMAGGAWPSDRRPLFGERFERDLAYILGSGPDGKPGRDIEPRSLGLAFAADRNANRRGVVVTSVDPKSLASDSGLRKDDIVVSIDGKPVTELVAPDARPLAGLIQLQLDLATRTGTVPLVIIRGEKEQTLQMTLK
jgi:hypothetical protein